MSGTAFRIVKNTAALFLGKASIVIFSFAFIIYAARFLGVEDFGTFTLARGYFDLFMSLAAFSLTNVITREIARAPEMAGRYITTGMLVSLGTTLACVVILVVLSLVSPYAADTRISIYLACIALFPAALSMMYEAGFLAHERAEFVTVGTLLENILRTALSFGVLLLGYDVVSLFIVLIISRIIMLLVYAVLSHCYVIQLTWSFDATFTRRLFHEWKVFALENGLANVYWNLSIIVLSFVRGEAAVGIYGAAYRILSLFSMVADSYTLANFPYMSRLYSTSVEQFRRMSALSIKYMLALALPGAAISFFLAEPVIVLLYSNRYEQAAGVLSVLVWVMVLRFVNPYMSYLLFAQGKQNKSLHTIIISLLIYMPVCYGSIYYWGASGAAISLLVAVTLSFFLYLWFQNGPAEALHILRSLGGVALAVAGLGVFLFAFQHLNVFVLAAAGIAIYSALFIVLRVPAPDERQMLRAMLTRLAARFGLRRRATAE